MKGPYVSTAPERCTWPGFFGARYYSSKLGRFLTPDWSDDPEPVPYADLTDPQSLNLYAYARNNPVTNTDPDGHLCCFGWLQSAWGALASGAPTIPEAPPECHSDPCVVSAPGDPSMLQQVAAAAAFSAAGSVERNLQMLGAVTTIPAPQSVTLPDGTRSTMSVAMIVPPTGGLAEGAEEAAAALDRIAAATGNETITVSSREAAEAIAKQALGDDPTSFPKQYGRDAGSIIRKSADGRIIVRDDGDHLNIQNLSTGGNLHVRFGGN